MRLLFDQNLSFKLCIALADCFPNSTQTGQIGLATANDRTVWNVAREGGFTLVSQDADFAELAFYLGPPPKVIWLRCGNQPTGLIAGLLRRQLKVIEAFEADPTAVCLELY